MATNYARSYTRYVLHLCVLIAVFGFGFMSGAYKHRIKNFVLRRSDTPVAITSQPTGIGVDARPANSVNLDPSTPADNRISEKIKESATSETTAVQPKSSKWTDRALVTITNTRREGSSVIVSTLISRADVGDICDLDIFYDDLAASDQMLYKTYYGKVVQQEGGILTCDGFNVPFIDSAEFKPGPWRFTVTVHNSYAISSPTSSYLKIEAK